MMSHDPFATPSWVQQLVGGDISYDGPGAPMNVAIALALANAHRGGGPFGAVIADERGRVIEVGWNCVIESRDPTAHAEVHAIRRACRKLGTHDLALAPGAPFALHSSCAPCIQCFGAIYWSGLAGVYAAAESADAERIGFLEGPVTAELWERAKRDKGIEFTPGFGRGEAALEPFREYVRVGGRVY